MPFTPSHAVAAAPLWLVARGWLPLSALVVGTMAPDYEFLLRLRPSAIVSHSVVGLVVFCLPSDQKVGPGDRFIAQQLGNLRLGPDGRRRRGPKVVAVVTKAAPGLKVVEAELKERENRRYFDVEGVLPSGLARTSRTHSPVPAAMAVTAIVGVYCLAFTLADPSTDSALLVLGTWSPLLGVHNQEVLHEMLGIGESDYALLVARGALGEKP